jgi:dihydrofolate reductase
MPFGFGERRSRLSGKPFGGMLSSCRLLVSIITERYAPVLVFLEVSMRRIRYQVACSLDGYIADTAGQTSWIVDEPGIDFTEPYDQFDTLLMGRRTYESLQHNAEGFWGKRVFVFSHTLRQDDHPAVTVISGDVETRLNALRSQPGKDIWLFGGGELLRSLLAIGYVDTIEPAIIPVLLGWSPFLGNACAPKQAELDRSSGVSEWDCVAGVHSSAATAAMTASARSAGDKCALIEQH